MRTENTCIFCAGPIEEGHVCSWCGFSQINKNDVPGTLKYGAKTDVYVVGDVLTVDGESTSYMAYDTHNQRKVVLKEFLPVSMIAPREGNTIKVQPGKQVLFKNLMMDFEDLYTTLSRVENKALQKIYNVYHDNGTIYAVLEYVKGDSLKQNLIKRGKPYTFKEARWLFQDLFILLKDLETLNIAHGGISDETVYITPDNNAVLTGFAIRDLRVKNDHIMYKLYNGFSAPEQYSQDQFAGFYTDIYSISALFYYAVTGKLYSQGAFDLKDVHRLMPRYAIETLRYATKPNPQDRINNFDDFILMLDNKAIIEKPKSEKVVKIETELLDKKYLPFIAIIVIIVLFTISLLRISSKTDNSTNSQIYQSSQSFADKLEVPSLVGKSYNEIINDVELNKYFFFDISEDYSSKYSIGEVISHQPEAGTTVKIGTTIYLTVSKGERLVEMPDGLIGQSIEYVSQRLEDLGIKYTIKEMPQTQEYPYGVVVGTDIQRGVKINPQRDYIIIYVSDNTPIVTGSPTPSPSPTPASNSTSISSEYENSSSNLESSSNSTTSSNISSNE